MNSEQAPRTAVGRFAPSPSGRMHLGNVFCALLSWLSARHDGGRWLLRIEDLDTQRCRREYADALEYDLHWLGLDWDEGGSLGGEHGPYYQSLRTDIYRRFFERLEAAGLTYPCFCSRADLKASQAPHASDHAPVYAGTCRHLTPAERERLAAERRPSVRLALPDAESRFDDGHYGPQLCNLQADCGDFVLRRADGVFAYQLAVVVDDALMGVNQVVRGCDLLESTHMQLAIYRLLGFDAPQFIHLPLLMSEHGQRLAKRDRGASLADLRRAGVSPAQIIGRLAHCAGQVDTPRPLMPADLVADFDWRRVPTANILFEP